MTTGHISIIAAELNVSEKQVQSCASLLLAHISPLSDRNIKDPNEAVKVNQKVMATVLEVDVKRKRILLSLKRIRTDRSRTGRRHSQSRSPKNRSRTSTT